MLIEGLGGRTTLVRLSLARGRIARVTDYAHCPWVVPALA